MELKFTICPVCFDHLNTDVYFCSDGYLYDQKSFQKLELRSTLTREQFLYWLPWRKLMII